MLKALQGRGFLQSLAEPNLIAYNGEEASFLAGGEIPIPVVQGVSGQVTVQYKEFGIRLTFRPTIAGDVIRLKLRPEVSSLDFNNGVILSGFRIPALNTRRAETDVELRDGQSFAIAGLMNNISQTDRQAIPILSTLPIIGNLFKSKAERAEQTELMVLITPRLVRALDPDEVPLLPTRPGEFIDPAGDEGEDAARAERRARGRAALAADAADAAGRGAQAASRRRRPPGNRFATRAEEGGSRVPWTRRHVTSERGAVLVQVAIALVGLMALSAFVIDYGVLWASRRQAQNAADAAAMAGAISMAFVDMNDQALARQAAIDVASGEQRLGAGAGHHRRRRDVSRLPTGIARRWFERVHPGGRVSQPAARQPAADILWPVDQRHRARREGDGDRGSAVRRLDGLREAVRDRRQVDREPQRPGRSGLERGGHVRALRPERQQPRAALLSPADYYEAPGQAGGSYQPERHRVHPRLHGTRRVGSRPPHRAEGGQPEPGDCSRVVPPGRDQPDRRARRRQLSRQHRHL